MSSRSSEGRPLWRMLAAHPRLFDKGRARWRMTDLAHALASLPDVRHVRPLLAALADHSPYLWQLVETDPARLTRIIEADPHVYLEALLEDLRNGTDRDEAALMQRLRQGRQSLALLVALADLGGAWTLEQVLQALTRAADAFISAALAHLLRCAQAAGRLRIDPAMPEVGCGLVVLGLGKLGGSELNYSSDVDLVVLFDPRSPALTDPGGAKTLFVRMVRDLVRILQQPTGDGHVLRVDLRLRPEPGASAVAVSTDAALLYYEQFGQTWERAALIKARPVAGDRDLGTAFFSEMAPFIWRKYLDFAAIADIHAMKRRIYAAKGGSEIAIAGHDVKLGRGGIRDVEFFVQAQQLIFGGKQPRLRGARTLPMLQQLRRDGWISQYAFDDLTRAYVFLRKVEHRLQMIGDAQTHVLPADASSLERFARFCGFKGSAQFSEVLQRHLLLVAHHYGLLFEQGSRLGAPTSGGFSFGGPADDPETLHNLAKLGFRDTDVIFRAVRAWHSGLRPAVQSTRAREVLTELTPKLLLTFSRTADPDAAVAGFDRSLERMPAATELFAILSANDAVRTLYGDILGSAPRLAQAVTSHPHLLDIAIDPTVSICLDEDEMTARVGPVLAHLTETEDVLDAVRDYQHAEHFLIGVRLLSGYLSPDEASSAYTALAVGVIRALLSHVGLRLKAAHGELPGSSFALIAMGKLGSREMTATSDLDLVLIYDFDPDHPETDGHKPVPAPTYFTRMTQRLVSALSLPTRRGRLYDVDMRLRPSGGQGPLATKFSAFTAYQRTTARTWEHMALTRARVIAGDALFGQRVTVAIEDVLRTVPRPRLREDIAEMRALIHREKPAQDAWDLKLSPGGLIDAEFIAQYLALRGAPVRSDGGGASTRQILEKAAASGELPSAGLLADAHRLISDTTQLMRLALTPGQSPETVGKGVRLRMIEAAGMPNFTLLRAALRQATETVQQAFDMLIVSESGHDAS